LSKEPIPSEKYQLINWEAVGKAMEESTKRRRVFISKRTAGMCGEGKFAVHWKEWERPDCSRCGSLRIHLMFGFALGAMPILYNRAMDIFSNSTGCHAEQKTHGKPNFSVILYRRDLKRTYTPLVECMEKLP
jgi:hypothetical protein